MLQIYGRIPTSHILPRNVSWSYIYRPLHGSLQNNRRQGSGFVAMFLYAVLSFVQNKEKGSDFVQGIVKFCWCK